MKTESATGQLFGLGPDGVGYIAVPGNAKAYGFILENVGSGKSFQDMGWKDGLPVQFRLDASGKVREIKPSKAT